MNRIKLILIVTIILFISAASVLVFFGSKQSSRPDPINLPLSDLVQSDPVRFGQLKSVKC